MARHTLIIEDILYIPCVCTANACNGECSNQKVGRARSRTCTLLIVLVIDKVAQIRDIPGQ